MPSTAADYRNAALERMGDADQLKRLERYPLAMYAAGGIMTLPSGWTTREQLHAAA